MAYIPGNIMAGTYEGAPHAHWVAGGSAFYDGASGAQYADLQMAAQFKLLETTPSAIASGALIDVWAKRTPAGVSQGVWARLTLGPSQSLQLLAGNGAAATVLASAGIASTLASGIYLGQSHTLTLRTFGVRADVWLATGALSASPVLSASSPFIGQSGNPAIRTQTKVLGTLTTSEVKGLLVQNVNLFGLGPSAVDTGARETFRFESHPDGRVYQGNASAFTVDRLADYRGQFPKMPPVPTAATGPARVVVLQGEIDNVQGLDGPDIALSTLERFRFLR